MSDIREKEAGSKMKWAIPSPYHYFLSIQVHSLYFSCLKKGICNARLRSVTYLQNFLPQSLSDLITLDNLGLNSERNFVRVQLFHDQTISR